MSAFFVKNQLFFFSKIIPFITDSVIISITDHASGIRLPDSSKLTIYRKNDSDVTTWRCRVSLVNFSYWSKFHGSRVVTVFVYKGLTRNPENRNTSIWVLPNIWLFEGIRDTKFGTNVSSENLLNAAKWHFYSFYRF